MIEIDHDGLDRFVTGILFGRHSILGAVHIGFDNQPGEPAHIEIEFVETAYLTGGDGTRISWNSSCGLDMDLQSIVLILLAILIAYLFRNETK